VALSVAFEQRRRVLVSDAQHHGIIVVFLAGELGRLRRSEDLEMSASEFEMISGYASPRRHSSRFGLIE
jgi:hypothetical protein